MPVAVLSMLGMIHLETSIPNLAQCNQPRARCAWTMEFPDEHTPGAKNYAQRELK